MAVLGIIWWSFWEVFEVLVGVEKGGLMRFLGTLRRGFRVSSGRVRVRVRLDQSGWSG